MEIAGTLQYSKGRILVINRATSVSRCLAQSLAEQGWYCTFVDSDSEADALLEHELFDFIVYGSESGVIVKRRVPCRQIPVYTS